MPYRLKISVGSIVVGLAVALAGAVGDDATQGAVTVIGSEWAVDPAIGHGDLAPEPL